MPLNSMNLYDSDSPLNMLEIIRTAQARCKTAHYDPLASKDYAMFEAIANAVAEAIVANAPTSEVVGSASLNQIVTGTASGSPQTIITAEDAFYQIFVTHYVTATAASAGIHTLGIGFTDGAGATIIYPAATLDLTTLGRQEGSASFFASAGTLITYDTDVPINTVGPVSFSLRIKLVRLA